MKKISFGSFPFINIDKKTRMCLDKYLIKTFADQIIITDIFSNLNTAKDFFYLTPDVIIDQLYDFSRSTIRRNHVNQSGMVRTRGILKENEIIPISTKAKLIIDNEYFLYENKNILLEAKGPDKKNKSNALLYNKIKDPYLDVVKRGFFILRNFYKKVSQDPFYRDIVYLPVYSEKLEVLNPVKLTGSQFKYSFFLLTNDLTKNLRLDEVSFNESAVINALYIFTQLFPGKKLTEFDEKDLEKLLKVYKFFEEYRISPIQFFTIIYRIFYVFATAKSLEDAKQVMIDAAKKPPFNQIFTNDVIKALFEVMVEINKKDLVEIINFVKNFTPKLNIELNRKNQERFWYVIETILKNNKIMNLIQNVADTYAERLKILNQNFKFRDIIIIFEELVKYNKINSNDIIKDTNFNLNFKLELNNEIVAFNEQIIKKRLDETFANFLADADKYIKALFDEKIKKFDPKNNNSIKAMFGAALSRKAAEDEAERYHRIEREMRDIQMRMMQVRESDPDEYARLQMVYNDLANQLALLTPKLNNDIIAMNIMQTASSHLNNKYANMYEQDARRISEEILNIEQALEKDDIPDDERERLQLRLITLQREYNELHQRIKEFQAAASSDLKGLKLDKFDSSNVNLEIAKTELGELYQTLKNLFMNQSKFNIYLRLTNSNPDLFTPDGFKKFIEKREYQTDDEEILAIEFKDMDLALKEVADVLAERFLQEVEAKFAKAQIDQGFLDKVISDIRKTLLNFNKIRDLIYERFLRILCSRVCKIFATTFKKNLQKGEISFNETTYGIHPMIKNLLKNPNNFKSFIFGFDELINLYDLLYLTEVEKFLLQSASGFNFSAPQRAPIKLTQVINKFNYVFDILGIKENPLWVISRSKIFLSLPDFMSLTRDRIFNSIKKEEIQSYCKIDYGKIWNELDFGSAFGGKEQQYKRKIKDIERKLDKVRKEIKEVQKEKDKAKDKNKKKELNKKFERLKTEEDFLLTSLKALKSTMDLFNLQKDNLRLNAIQEEF